MAFFISDILSALGPDISVRESVGQRADDGSDMKKDFFYHILGTRHFGN